MAERVLVIGIGNELRGDDAAGLLVARGLPAAGADVDVHEAHGEPIGLLDVWDGRGTVVVVDSMRSGAAPGTVLRFDASHEPLPAALRPTTSTHAMPVADVIELGRTLGRLPEHLIVVGVEGRSFETGGPLSPEVRAALPAVADAVLRAL